MNVSKFASSGADFLGKFPGTNSRVNAHKVEPGKFRRRKIDERGKFLLIIRR